VVLEVFVVSAVDQIVQAVVGTEADTVGSFAHFAGTVEAEELAVPTADTMVVLVVSIADMAQPLLAVNVDHWDHT
jgi:hypothetical protein